MKLINPVGRVVSTFETQANLYCPCICSSGAYSAKYEASYDVPCYCACNSSPANKAGNDQMAISRF